MLSFASQLVQCEGYHPSAAFDLQNTGKWAAGLISAGFRERRMISATWVNGEGIKLLLFGKKITATSSAMGTEFQVQWAANGEFQ